MRKYFLSNCLIEAIKAKVKDPENVRIHFMSRKLNRGSFHWYWYDLKEGSMMSFSHDKSYRGQTALFKGFINANGFTMFEGTQFAKMSRLGWTVDEQREYARRKGFMNKEPFHLQMG